MKLQQAEDDGRTESNDGREELKAKELKGRKGWKDR